MAIRIGPPTDLARLRLQWHATLRQYGRRYTGFQDRLAPEHRGVVGRWLEAVRTGLAGLHPEVRAAARREADLNAFVERYEDLVSLLCWAAQDGVHRNRDEKYATLRVWMQANYPRVRPLLRPYLAPWEGVLDPFEELFAPECVDDVINDLSGILYVTQTRGALDTCCEALRTVRSGR